MLGKKTKARIIDTLKEKMEDLLLNMGEYTKYIGQRDTHFLELLLEPCTFTSDEARASIPYAEGWSILLTSEKEDRALLKHYWDDKVAVFRRGMREVDMTQAFKNITGDGGTMLSMGRSYILVLLEVSAGTLLKIFKWNSMWSLREIGRNMIFRMPPKNSSWHMGDIDCVGSFFPDREKVEEITIAYLPKVSDGRTRFCKDVDLPFPTKILRLKSFITLTYAGAIICARSTIRGCDRDEIEILWTAKCRGGQTVHRLKSPIRGIGHESIYWCNGHSDVIFLFDRKWQKFVKVDLKKNKTSPVVNLVMPNRRDCAATCIRSEERDVIIVATEFEDKLRITPFDDNGKRFGKKLVMEDLYPVRFAKHGDLIVKDGLDHHAVVDVQKLLAAKILG